MIQLAQLSQRDLAAGWVSYRQKWKTVSTANIHQGVAAVYWHD